MKSCKNCKTIVLDDVEKCPNCQGEDFEEITAETEATQGKKEDSHNSLQQYKSAEKKVDDKVSAKAQKEKKMNQKKLMGILCILVMVFVILADVMFIMSEKKKNNRPEETTEKTTIFYTEDTVDEFAKYKTPYKMSDKPTDCKIKIGELVYQLPMPVSVLKDSGWSLRDAEKNFEDLIKPQEYKDIYFGSEDHLVLVATIVNKGSEPTKMTDCTVCAIKFSALVSEEEARKASIAGDVLIGYSTRTKVERVYGECKDITTSGINEVYTYTYGKNCYVQLMFDKEDGIIMEAKLYNDK